MVSAQLLLMMMDPMMTEEEEMPMSLAMARLEAQY